MLFHLRMPPSGGIAESRHDNYDFFDNLFTTISHVGCMRHILHAHLPRHLHYLLFANLGCLGDHDVSVRADFLISIDVSKHQG